jgi:glucose/arabinose dehydrogenase
MRNPWRFSFDPLMGGLFLPDIGEMVEDELNYQPAADDGSQNYGWPCYEGTKPFEPERCEPGTDFMQPVMSLPLGAHGDCSVIGGRVYRGTLYPDLIGRYIFTDYCSGNFRTVVAGDWNNVTLHTGLAPFGLVAIGAGNDGELYAVNRENGKIYRVTGEGNGVTATPSSTPTGTLPTATSTPFPSSTPSSTPTLTPTSTTTPTPVLDEFIYLSFIVEEDNDP